MLELPVLFIKDAARPVKRICLEEFKKVKDDSLAELSGIISLIATMYTFKRTDKPDSQLWKIGRERF